MFTELIWIRVQCADKKKRRQSDRSKLWDFVSESYKRAENHDMQSFLKKKES